MKLDPISILVDEKLKLDKKFYLISGNELSLIEKIKSVIIQRYKKKEYLSKKNIDHIDNFLDEGDLFGSKKIFLVKSIKGLSLDGLEKLREKLGVFIFVQENSQKIKKIKNIFLKDGDACLIDCYEMDRNSKIKVLNEFIKISGKVIEKDIYLFLVAKLDNKYCFLENNLIRIFDLDPKDINIQNIKKILTVDITGKEKLFFSIFKKNREIITAYRNKIITLSDVNELYYFCRSFCYLIIESKNEEDFTKKIPTYLFKEKNLLIDIFRNYTLEKKKVLMKLLMSTESVLRKESSLSLILGLRFLLNIKKITIS